ncbi:neurofilament medium polypeptide [Limosa lapponica baueri]|uniref:Neurofilament medium polypeptide n=1 Tax=Limosa lapponica baueri TaxID=1758121 RepID=A0A2I0T0D0_LIMLA|nr:neurofilament medium polypeptide [Limosa lapponica baueri]
MQAIMKLLEGEETRFSAFSGSITGPIFTHRQPTVTIASTKIQKTKIEPPKLKLLQKKWQPRPSKKNRKKKRQKKLQRKKKLLRRRLLQNKQLHLRKKRRRKKKQRRKKKLQNLMQRKKEDLKKKK